MATKKKTTKRSPAKRKQNEKITVRALVIALLSLLIVAGVFYLTDPATFETRLSAMFADAAQQALSQPVGTAKPTDAPPISTNEPANTDAPASGAEPTVNAGKTLDVYVIDVGQGDSIFLRSPNGSTMLIDASESKAFDAIDTFLKSQNVDTLDVVVATHPHSDHIGGMTKVINAYDIGAFYLSSVTHTTKTYENMISALKQKKVKVMPAVAGADSFIKWDDDVEVRILSPFDDVEYDELNDWSVMLRVKYGDTAIMLTGDAEMYAEGIALDNLDPSLFKADVLKLGHHGSSSSTSPAFFAAVNPRIAIMSLGKDNDYGHPHRETLELLKNADIPYYRTDESGTVHVTLDGAEVSVTTEK